MTTIAIQIPVRGGPRAGTARAALLLALAGLLAVPGPVRGDGCVFARRGQYIPEKEQRAFLEWDAGRETLFVATRVAASTDPTLWVLPVPSRPEQVEAEPVDRFRHVVSTRPAVARARRCLSDTAAWTLALDSGLLPGLGVLTLGAGAKASATFGPVRAAVGAPEGVVVYQHVEKLGMVVEVVTAQTTEALDRYLAGKDLGVRAVEIAALEPYLNRDYVLVCGWVAGPGSELAARAVRIDFDTPTVFYPLRPTRVYEGDVATAIYVRGWVQPQAGLQLPGLHCQYVRGKVSDVSLGEINPVAPHAVAAKSLPDTGDTDDERLTRVELSASPRTWTQDLVLEPRAPAALTVAAAIETLDTGGLWLVSWLVGAALAAFLPVVALPADRRRATDWLWSSAVGAALGFSIFASAAVLYFWCRVRRPVEPSPLGPVGRVAGMVCLICVALCLAAILQDTFLRQHFHHQWRVLETLALITFVVAFVVGWVSLSVLTVSALRSVAGRVGPWLLALAAAHCGVVVLACLLLETWLGQYLS